MTIKAELPDRVPSILRDDLENTSIINTLLPQYLGDLSFESAVAFIEGALEHQSRLGVTNAKGEPECKFFPVKEVLQVEIVSRKSGDYVVGKKARVHFLAWDGDAQKDTEQYIETGWIEFNGFNVEELAWEIALSRTLKEIAESLVGKDPGKIVFRKMFQGADLVKGNRVRYLGDIKVYPQSSKAADKKPSGRNERRASSRRDATLDPEEYVEKMDPSNLLSDDDFDILVDLVAKVPGITKGSAASDEDFDRFTGLAMKAFDLGDDYDFGDDGLTNLIKDLSFDKHR